MSVYVVLRRRLGADDKSGSEVGGITGNIEVTAGETLYVEVDTTGEWDNALGSVGAGGTAGASASGGVHFRLGR